MRLKSSIKFVSAIVAAKLSHWSTHWPPNREGVNFGDFFHLPSRLPVFVCRELHRWFALFASACALFCHLNLSILPHHTHTHTVRLRNVYPPPSLAPVPHTKPDPAVLKVRQPRSESNAIFPEKKKLQNVLFEKKATFLRQWKWKSEIHGLRSSSKAVRAFH